MEPALAMARSRALEQAQALGTAMPMLFASNPLQESGPAVQQTVSVPPHGCNP